MSDTTKYCQHCGDKDDTGFCDNCLESDIVKYNYCGHCGYPGPDREKECRHQFLHEFLQSSKLYPLADFDCSHLKFSA